MLMKRQFPDKSLAEKMLTDGYIVCLFSGTASKPPCVGDIGPPPRIEKTLEAHLGLVYLSPYAPTFQCVRLGARDDGHQGMKPHAFVEVAQNHGYNDPLDHVTILPDHRLY